MGEVGGVNTCGGGRESMGEVGGVRGQYHWGIRVELIHVWEVG